MRMLTRRGPDNDRLHKWHSSEACSIPTQDVAHRHSRRLRDVCSDGRRLCYAVTVMVAAVFSGLGKAIGGMFCAAVVFCLMLVSPFLLEWISQLGQLILFVMGVIQSLGSS